MKDCVLIGSKAIERYKPFYRPIGDLDWLTVSDEYTSVKGCEYHKCGDYEGLNYLYNRNRVNGVMSLGDLYTLKLSHSFWDVNWSKTMSDILFFQSHKVKYDKELLDMLVKDWTMIHGKKRVNLNKGNDDFFNKHVERRYKHDEVHQAIAFYDKPLFTHIQINPDNAMVSEKLFNKLSYEEKLNICREEAFVIALERYIFPADGNASFKASYVKAMKALVTQLSKGWFPEFIVTNWTELYKTNINYVDKFNKNIKEIIND